jgi:hypothetical protein
MHGHAPNAIITDQDRAMKNAIEVVFPKSRHRWCLWHLMKKVPEKLGRHSNYESIKTLLHGIVYDSLSKSDFIENWGKMIEYYGLQDNEWLKGLFGERDHWVPVYVRDTFWAGMSTTQRSESMNSFFDGYVNSKTALKQFVEQYDKALRDKMENERLADFRSLFSITENKRVFDKVKNIAFKVSINEKEFGLQCTCCLFEFKGILCRHILCVLQLIDKTESVPTCYVLPRWRKDIKRRYTLIKCGLHHLDGNLELQRVNKACDAFYEVASTRINTEEELLKVMNWIEDLKIELTCKETSPEFIEEDSSVRDCVLEFLILKWLVVKDILLQK